jgi:alpha-beta hydrolase superfamily lysophospholipase
VGDEAVGFQADDGAILRGHFYATSGPQRRAVILAHGSGEDQRVWQRFARDLAERGIAALTFDFRGYGESAGTKSTATVQRDLAAALLFVQSRDFPLIYLLGPELGGIAALKVAAASDVAGVVTIATPLSLQGASVQADLPRIRERKLFIGAGADELAALAPEPKETFAAGPAPIDQLFGGTDARVWMKVMEFLER